MQYKYLLHTSIVSSNKCCVKKIRSTNIDRLFKIFLIKYLLPSHKKGGDCMNNPDLIWILVTMLIDRIEKDSKEGEKKSNDKDD